MAPLNLIEGDINSPFTYSFSPSLFNSPRHLRLQREKDWRSFFIYNDDGKNIAGAIHFHIAGDQAFSPAQAPFGGIESDESTPDEIIFNLIHFAVQKLRSSGVRKITVKSAPEIYSSRGTAVNTFFLNAGFHVLSADLSSVILVDRPTLTEKLHRSERRRFEKASAAGLTFSRLPIQKLEEVYSFIKECRERKRFFLSMSWEQLDETVGSFNDRFILFGVFDGSRLAAASIAIKVTDDVLYEFYHDHHHDYDNLSPVVMLVSGIYDFCAEQRIKFFDLGTSSINNQPNFPLLHFKALLGAKVSSKLTLEKTIA